MSERAIFLDKDGTLIDDVPYNVNPARITLLPGVAEGLRCLHGAGYRLIVVSNQSGVARGYFREEALRAVEDRLRGLLAEAGVPLDGFYYCPHHPDGLAPGYAVDCDCRKPAPGLILRAAADFGIDLNRSWLAGDILNDVEAGRRAGCRTVLIDNGHETEWAFSPQRLPHHLAADLREAAAIITCVSNSSRA
jgi:D-glycero-D-manno-heptose 1,7-bisphosphate phosphatase